LEILSGTNYVSASFGTVSGGLGNGVGWRADLSSIGGGAGNLIGGVDLGPMGATIGGGIFNRIENNRSEPPGASQTIAGGECNSINTSGFTTISGGRSNRIGDDSAFSTIAGGCLNLIGHISPQATIGGGSGNGVWTWTGTISGGANNQVYQPGFGGSIGGGYGNIIRGAAAAIPGGRQNSAEGECSFAAGSHAIAYHSGAFVWADHSGVFFQSASSNEFAVRATGGVRFVTAIDTNGTPTAGVQVSAGGTGWSAVSDRNMKENFEAVDGKEVLEKVAALSIQRWNMKTQSDSVRHIGPMAQDFHAAFGLGEDNRHINSVDVDGVALAAIQGLNQAVEEKDAQIRALEKRLMELEKVVQKLIR
jgi:hypothetical protein